ncbi:tetratricopeptide repeat protein [Massilia sp. CCM 8733]|uniref:Tetratricopeptide repeat protein n=1 Tax=Massilia mucilaginosa TaxID=2609282 RepID=A0ABX0NZK3_9BURK|nr:tetratricopeptide repeat protein [Massilia mucilaginosa]NHZ92219.1 tetratricopeptide repeat protein [Massilia mucilaginosa]
MVENLFRKLKAMVSGAAQSPRTPAATGTDAQPVDVEQCVRQLQALSDAIDPALASADAPEVDARCNDLAQFLASLEAHSALPAIRRILGAGYVDLGSAYRQIRRVAEAEMAYAKAIGVLQSITHIDEHRLFATAQLAASKNHLGLLYMDCGPQDKAIAAFDDAIAQRKALARQAPGDCWNLVYLGGALCNRAHIARERGEHRAAMALYDEAIALLDELAPDDDCERSQARFAAMSAAFPGLPEFARQYRVNAQDGKRLLPA